MQLGGVEIILLYLRRRYGSLDETVEAQVRALPMKHLKDLAVALLDFDTPADLQMWLLHRSPLPKPEPPAATGSLELDS